MVDMWSTSGHVLSASKYLGLTGVKHQSVGRTGYEEMLEIQQSNAEQRVECNEGRQPKTGPICYRKWKANL